MDVEWSIKLILIFILLILSAFFSGSEVALFSLEKKKLKDFGISGKRLIYYISDLLKEPRRLLFTILLGNTIINVATSILAVNISVELAKLYDLKIELVLTVQIFLLTFLILIFSEITPKLIASKHPGIFASISVVPIYWSSVLLYPISKIFTDVIRGVVSRLKYNNKNTIIQRDEISDLSEISMEKGTIEQDEHELIQSLVSFKYIITREVMTPRVDIVAVPESIEFEELLKIITNSGHSRIPVFEGSLDNIIGILYSKDLLKFIHNSDRNELNLKELSRKPVFIPENKKIESLLKEFQKNNFHIGIVVDEYGGTSGLVSMEDILEEIVGEIRDEYDKEEVGILKISENEYIVEGKVSIEDINTLLNEDFSSEDDDYDTIGGFIYTKSGSIPEKDYSIIQKSIKFTVLEIVNNRINKVGIKILSEKL